MEKSNLVKTAEDQKILLLNTVSKKVIEMTQKFPELNVLDYNISKSDRKMSFSAGYKQEVKPQQKFNLSPLFLDVNERQNVHRECRFNTGYPDHQSFAKSQNFDSLKDKKIGASTPMGIRPGLIKKFDTTVATDKADILTAKSDQLHPLHNTPVLRTGENIQHEDEEDTSKTRSGTAAMFNDNDGTMDQVYLDYILNHKATEPRRLIKMLVGKMSKDDLDDGDFREIKNDDDSRNDMDAEVPSFVPGRPWLTKEQRRSRDLAITMSQIEHSILDKNFDAYQVAYEILLHADQFEREGRNLKQEIRTVLEASHNEHELTDSDHRDGKENFWAPLFSNNSKEEKRKTENLRIQSDKLETAFKGLHENMKKHEKKTRERRNRESLKTQFATNDQVEDDCNNILEDAFTTIDRKIKKFEEKKKTRFAIKEEDDNKTEDLKVGSFDSTMYH